MKQSVEREIKLRAGAGFSLPSELGEPIEARRFSSTYHDTPDHRLAACGITLRYRAEAGSGAWQLKLPSGDDRLELEVQGSPRQVPQMLIDLLPAVTRGRPLRPAATLVTRRHGVMVRDAGRDLAQPTFPSAEGERHGRTGVLPRSHRLRRRARAPPPH